jgi:L-2-hydroxyglutarate oxidase LhgO
MARTVERALWSPTTAVADPLEVIEAVAADARSLNIDVRMGEEVLHAEPGLVRTGLGTYSVGHIVNAAGLYADRVAAPFGMADGYVMLPFKGLYWYSDAEVSPLQRHVYPVPDPRNPFLGVHATVTAHGKVKVGPTAIPALWREGYRGLGGFDARELGETLAGLSRLAVSPHHDFAALVRAELPKYVRSVLVGQAAALVPGLDVASFRIRGKAGIRAQLYDTANRRLEMDFVVRGDSRSTHMLNSVSPAWTSALAVAEHTVDGMVERGAL